MTPHHLLLTDELVRSYDPVFKVNPPLRTAEDVQALREALADGTIDAVATDHAPHPVEDKDCEWAAAAMGMTGLETALSVVQQAMVDTGLLDWAGVADRMSARPARIGRLAATRAGRSRRASPATSPWSTRLRDGSSTRRAMATASRNTPFARPHAARPGGRHLLPRAAHRAGDGGDSRNRRTAPRGRS